MKYSFDITGMTCSACSARIEKAVKKMPGIEAVSVNLLKNSMSVDTGDSGISAQDIVKKVEDTGYGAAEKVQASPVKKGTAVARAEKSEAAGLRNRFIISLVFMLPLFYIAMGEMMKLPMPGFLSGMENVMVLALTQLLLSLPILFVNFKYFKTGFKNLFRLSPNMDSLIAIGSGAAFAYSLYAVYRIAFAVGHGDLTAVHDFSMSLYFESSAMILTLITLGKYFEARAKGKTSEAITKLMDLAPKTAIVERDGIEAEIASEDVAAGDILIVKAGAAVPTDGILISGGSSVDESAITGESMPVAKKAGDKVTGGTINQMGYFKMQATAVGEQTTLAKIIRLVDEATSSKAPIAKLADKISGIFVPVVIGIALVAFIIWISVGKGFEFALTVAISVLVISCPCALGLATPTAIMVGTGRGASAGILFKSAESLETTHHIDTVVLDKTGTVTEGRPEITDIIPSGTDEEHLLSVAASLEKLSAHPLAVPIVKRAEQTGQRLSRVENFEIVPGQGIQGIIAGKLCRAGNRRMMEAAGIDLAGLDKIEDALSAEAKTPLYFAEENILLGLIAVADIIKPTSKAAVDKLTKMGIEVIMLTGDREKTALAIAAQAGITKVIAEVLPEDKEREVRKLMESGKKVAMVGDGINDAPALARADIGIAIGAGTEIAIESADVVLMKSDLMDVAEAVLLSKKVMRNIKQNLFWAFFYNTVGIPVAAGVLYPFTNVLLNPMIAAAAMSLSSVSVVLNALRLRLYKKNKATSNTDENPKTMQKGDIEMKKILTVEGMSCGHCSAAVKKALEKIEGVGSADVDLASKTASVVLTGQVPDPALKAAVEEAGYEVSAIN